MPYNTTAIPPRKETTGQTQLPLTRVKKIVAVDPDITVCSNNAAFVITLATEMFIQYLAAEAHQCAKLERKPRRNIQYKDLANAVVHHDNLEFLEDVVPKTVPYKQVKTHAAATRAKLKGEKKTEESAAQPNVKRQKAIVNGDKINGHTPSKAHTDDDPSAQLQSEMQQMRRDHEEDVLMAD
ncbi:hypothetical protein VTK73DRAFT_8367 [Phialemonium thermophilum]|uniref:Transcription factor CBF/NF-Y/archaeal histone domain-containing protein n=1 Tax=Phialemonium thermophilum TaxID=223376 RepID=A0ABR3XPB8_9PEZI